MPAAAFLRTSWHASLVILACLSTAAPAADVGGKAVRPRQWNPAATPAFDPPVLAAAPADGAGCVAVGYYILRDGTVAKARVMEGAFTRGVPKEFQQSFADAAIAAAER